MFGGADPEIIILPVNVVLPDKVLLPIWVVEPDTLKLPVIVEPFVTVNDLKTASEPLIMTFFQLGISIFYFIYCGWLLTLCLVCVPTSNTMLAYNIQYKYYDGLDGFDFFEDFLASSCNAT